MRISGVGPRAGFVVLSAAGASVISVLVAGQAWAGSASLESGARPGGGPGPVPAARLVPAASRQNP
jgi:hypothetical protein